MFVSRNPEFVSFFQTFYWSSTLKKIGKVSKLGMFPHTLSNENINNDKSSFKVEKRPFSKNIIRGIEKWVFYVQCKNGID